MHWCVKTFRAECLQVFAVCVLGYVDSHAQGNEQKWFSACMQAGKKHDLHAFQVQPAEPKLLLALEVCATDVVF